MRNKQKLVAAIVVYAVINTLMATLIPPAAIARAQTSGAGADFVSIEQLLGVIGTASLLMLGIIGFFVQRTLNGVESSVVGVGTKLTSVEEKIESSAKETRVYIDTELRSLGQTITHVDDVNRDARHEILNKIQPVSLRVERHETKIEDHERRLQRTEEKIESLVASIK